jgi:hypothetical protein
MLIRLSESKMCYNYNYYAPMSYTAPCVRFLMRQIHYVGKRGGGGGWRWKSRFLWTPVKFGPQKKKVKKNTTARKLRADFK